MQLQYVWLLLMSLVKVSKTYCLKYSLILLNVNLMEMLRVLSIKFHWQGSICCHGILLVLVWHTEIIVTEVKHFLSDRLVKICSIKEYLFSNHILLTIFGYNNNQYTFSYSNYFFSWKLIIKNQKKKTKLNNKFVHSNIILNERVWWSMQIPS